jgi:acetoin utilization deacetylase AcuC-like enzyme
MSSSSSSTPAASSSSPSPSVLVLYASHDLALVDDGMGTNKPVVRKRAILEALQRASKEDAGVAIDFQALSEPAKDLKIAERVHDPLLVELFATGWARWEALGPARDLYFSSGGRIDPEHWEELVPSQVAPRDAHQRPGNSLHGQICYFCQDQMTPITRHTTSIIHHDLAVTLRAVEAIKSGAARQVYACTTEPGHHSGPQSYGGYCFLNHSALATSLLQEHYGRVGLLDVDYHAGNGGYAVFAENPNVR